MWTIDGMEWDYPCRIERVAEVTPSEISGLLLNRTYFADIIGMYLKYTITLAVPVGQMENYNTIYEALTAPVPSHEFTLPYNSGEVNIIGRVTMVSDRYIKDGSGVFWRGTRFEVIANNPTKTMELGEAKAYGIGNFPDAADVPVGTTITMTVGGWVGVSDGDEVSY